MNFRLFSKFFLLILLFGFSKKAVSNNAIINSIQVDPDNKIYAGGFFDNTLNTDFVLARYNSDGSLDDTFNSQGAQPGITATGIREEEGIGFGNDSISSIIIDDNSKIVAVGFSEGEFFSDFALARYNTDGSLDSTFNPDGLLPGRPGVVLTSISAQSDVANGVIEDSQGRILIAGNTQFNINSGIAIVRYNSDGSLDTSFNSDGLISGVPGIAIFDISDQVSVFGNAITIDNDGKILVAGKIVNSDLSSNIILIRLNDDGTLDSNFNSGSEQDGGLGFAILGSLEGSEAFDVKVDQDNNYVLVGTIQNVRSSIIVTRLIDDGSFDPSFSSTDEVPGVVITNFNSESFDTAKSCVIDDESRIVVSGSTSGIIFDGSNNVSATSFLTVRYNNDGSLDETFNGGETPGFSVTPIENVSVLDTGVTINSGANSVIIDQNNNIVAGGFSNNGVFNDFALTRYNSDGTLDEEFNPDSLTPGIVLTIVTNGTDLTEDVFLGVAAELNLEEAAEFIPDPFVASQISFNLAGFSFPTVLPVEVIDKEKILISGFAKPNSLITIFLNDLPVSTTVTNSDGTWNTLISDVNVGESNIRALATDPISNLSLSSETIQVFIKDDIAKKIKLYNPSSGSIINKIDNVLVDGASSSNSEIFIFVNGSSVGQTISDKNGFWSFSLGNLPEGKYSLIASYEQEMIGEFSNETMFEVTEERTPKITEPLHNAIILKNSVIIKGLTEPNTNVFLLINEKNIKSKKSDNNGNVEFLVTDLSEGLYRCQIKIKLEPEGEELFSDIVSFKVELTEAVNSEDNLLAMNDAEFLNIKGNSNAASKIQLLLDGNAIFNTTMKKENSSWSYKLPRTKLTGLHEVCCVYYDSDNNVQSISKKTIKV